MSDVRPPRRRRTVRSMIGLGLLLVATVIVGVVSIQRFMPTPPGWLELQRGLEGRGYSRDWRPLDQISPHLVRAVMAGEDDGFCSHHGFDWAGIQAAMRYNASHKTRVHGGSTISQQTAKNVYLWPGRGWIRKGLEAGATVLIEGVWGKRRIMEVYLNVVEWAPGVYGAEAASQYWFHVPASSLTAPQAARLAAILPRPLKWQAAAPSAVVRKRLSRIRPGMGDIRGSDMADCVLKAG